jgi:class 3 adenylate cyclase
MSWFMKKGFKYRLYVWLMILSGIILAITLSMTSWRIIQGGKRFTRAILEERKLFLVNTLRFGHGVTAHAGTKNYEGLIEGLIELAMRSKYVRYLAVLDKDGKMIAQGDFPGGLLPLKNHDLAHLVDGKILEETENILLLSYHVEGIVSDEEHIQHHALPSSDMLVPPKPSWFLVGLDISPFKKHYHDTVVQAVGTGAAFLLLGILVIIFLAIIQGYELAHLAIEKLQKIKNVMGHFVPRTAKKVIEKDPAKKGLLDKYIQDATVLFLDIEGFSHSVQKHPPERLNRAIESFFSAFLDLIQKNGGDINEIAGDGMMVIFLDPDPTQHAGNAIRTALQVQEYCLKKSENGNQDLFPLKVNIGIQSGEAYLGSTKMRGSAGERWTFTASGAVTVLAARLAQHARGGQILIGEETARRIDGRLSLNHLGKIPLKNMEDSGEVYEIAWRRGR